MSIDPEAAIAAGRARRARDRRIANAVNGVGLIVFVAVVVLGSDDAGALAVFGAGTLSLVIEVWRTRGREGVERQDLQRTVAVALLLVSLWALGVHISQMVDDDIPVRSSYYLQVIGLGLLVGGLVFSSGRTGGFRFEVGGKSE